MSRCLGLKFYAVDAAGAPLAGGKVYTYVPGGGVGKTTYSDAAKTIPNTNPVILDAGGQADIYLDGITKMVIKTSAGVTITTAEKVVGNAATTDDAYTNTVVVQSSGSVGDDMTGVGSVLVDGSLTVTGDLTTAQDPVHVIYGTVTAATVTTSTYFQTVSEAHTNQVTFSAAIAAGTAANSSLYVNSTSGKLTVKDSTGTSHDAY